MQGWGFKPLPTLRGWSLFHVVAVWEPPLRFCLLQPSTSTLPPPVHPSSRVLLRGGVPCDVQLLPRNVVNTDVNHPGHISNSCHSTSLSFACQAYQPGHGWLFDYVRDPQPLDFCIAIAKNINKNIYVCPYHIFTGQGSYCMQGRFWTMT